MPFREHSQETCFGRIGESVAREWLQNHGYFVVPASQIKTEGAPMLLGRLRRHVLPDVLAAKDGASTWVEVKTKHKQVWYQRTGEWRTGCGLGHFDAYLQVERETGIKGYLAFIHLEERNLLLAPLAHLDSVAQRATPAPRGFDEPMVFFPVSCFDEYPLGRHAVGALRRRAIAPQAKHPWEKSLPVAHARGKQGTFIFGR